jgi:Fe2+ or Zn2+ uptake regulation protein
MICTSCGEVTQFRHPELEKALEEVAHAAGFEVITRQIKVFGTCHECS